jgi:hypothetical protein
MAQENITAAHALVFAAVFPVAQGETRFAPFTRFAPAPFFFGSLND